MGFCRALPVLMVLVCVELTTGCGDSPEAEATRDSGATDVADDSRVDLVDAFDASDGASPDAPDAPDVSDAFDAFDVSDAFDATDAFDAVDLADLADLADLPDVSGLADLGAAPVEVGPDGGVVHSADGVVTLRVPPGALDESVTITIAPLDESTLTPPDGLELHSVAYELGPDGLVFDLPIGVSLEIDPDEAFEDEARAVHYHQFLLHGSARDLEIVTDTVTRFEDDTVSVSGQIAHFSVISAANSPAYSQLVVPNPAGGVGQIFNFVHYAGVRRESAAGNAWRMLVQRADRGRFLELRLLPGVYLPNWPGGFFGPHEWPPGKYERIYRPEEGAYIYTGDLTSWVSDQTLCTRSGVTTDTRMDTTIGVYTLGGPFTSLVETRSRLIYTIDVECSLSSGREGYYEGDRFLVLSRSLGEIETPEIPPPPEVDPDEPIGTILGSDEDVIGAITLDDSGGSFSPIATTEAAVQAFTAYLRAGALDIFLLSEGGILSLLRVDPEDPSDIIDSYDFGVADASDRDVQRVLNEARNRRPQVAVVGETEARIIDPQPLFTWGITNLAAAEAANGEVTAQQYVFYTGPECSGAVCPPSGFAAAVLGHGAEGGEGGYISFSSTLGHGDSEAVPGSVLGMACRSPRQCVAVVASEEEGEARQLAVQVDIDATAPPGENLSISQLGQLPVNLGDIVAIDIDGDRTFVVAYEGAIVQAFPGDEGAISVIVDEAPEECTAIRGITTTAGEIAVLCDEVVYRRFFGPEAQERDGCGGDVRPGYGPEFGTGLQISAGVDHGTTIVGPVGSVWLVEAVFYTEEGGGLTLAGDSGRPVAATRRAPGEWSATVYATAPTAVEVGPIEPTIRVSAGVRPALQAGDRCVSYTLTATRERVAEDRFEGSADVVEVPFVGRSARLVDLTLPEGDTDVFTFDSADEIECRIELVGPLTGGLAVDFGVDFTVVDSRDKASGDFLAIARSRVNDVAYELHCIERGSERSPEVCTGGADEDQDSLVDCDDPDCHWESGCSRYREQCSNGIDDDGDWRIDCADPECRAFAGCASAPVEVCDGGLDEDGDGAVDCEDIDCLYQAPCSTSAEDCGNGVDDDGDDDADCDDDDCTEACFCFDESGGPNGDTEVRFGSALGVLGRAVCVYDVCDGAYSDEPIWDAAGFATGLGLGTPDGGDLLAPYVRPPMTLPIDVPVRLESFGSGDMYTERGGVVCGVDFPSVSVETDLPDIDSDTVSPLVLFGGVRSSSPSRYQPADECGAGLNEACPSGRQGQFHVFESDCTPTPGAAMVRVINLSPNQEAITVTQENELVTPEALFVADLAYGEASPYLAISDEGGYITRVWRYYDASDLGAELALTNSFFETSTGGDTMQAPEHGTCSTIVVLKQRADRFSMPAILVADDPIVCVGWRNVDGAEPVLAPCP